MLRTNWGNVVGVGIPSAFWPASGLVGLSWPLVADKSCQPSRKTGTAKRETSRRVELIRCPEPLSRMRYTVPPITR